MIEIQYVVLAVLGSPLVLLVAHFALSIIHYWITGYPLSV